MATPVVPDALAAGTSTSTAPPTSTEYVHIVRAPKDAKKKFHMIKFSSGTNIDFLQLTNTSVKMERENNLKDFKTAYNIDTMPKFGAGSEYGREQKDEARRKKYGINTRRYNADNQPWMMKVGKGKEAKRYKGVREGTITQNTSYYIFTQCADGAFEAFPVEEWYNFQPLVRYKYLNSEEAEEEFSRRDKTMNMFSIMVRNRIKNDDTAPEELEEDEKKSKKKTKKDKSLILTDMEDWAMSSEEEEDDDDDDDKPKKEKKKDGPLKAKKNSKHNDNDEAVEESDEGDFDDRELDYITSSGSESDLDERDKTEKYDDKGVDQEHGLKKLIDSEDESSEDEQKKEEENEEEEEEKKGKKKKKEKKEKKDGAKGAGGGDESESSSSSSESDVSDIEKNEDKFSSVLFMQKKKGSSRSNTPTFDKSAEGSVKTEVKQEAVKRKIEGDEAGDSQQKKMRTDSPVTPNPAAYSGEITEEAIRRYLMRKPMTAKEIVQKFKSKKPQMSKDQMTQKIGQLLKKINPDKKKVNNILYLSVKKTD